MGPQLIAGNWKMNCLRADGRELAEELHRRVAAGNGPDCAWLVCPPAPLLASVGEVLAGSAIALGGQDCHTAQSGAHTGDVSAAMLADAGCSHVIVGHSERRSDHGEDDATVRAKAEAACAAGLVPIVCVGETQAEREAGRTLAVVERQVRGSVPGEGSFVLAYEPVWAIGTGLTPTPEDVARAHGHIHAVLSELVGEARAEATNILYGGSVKPDNAAELLAVPRVGGALVGGASLKAEDFWQIGRQAKAV